MSAVKWVVAFARGSRAGRELWLLTSVCWFLVRLWLATSVLAGIDCVGGLVDLPAAGVARANPPVDLRRGYEIFQGPVSRRFTQPAAGSGENAIAGQAAVCFVCKSVFEGG